jgi:hypothetical protein
VRVAEALFAELKNQIGLRRLRLRRMKFVREQFFLAAAAQNIKRLVRFLSQAPSHSHCKRLVNRSERRKNKHNLKTTRRVSSLLKEVFQHPQPITLPISPRNRCRIVSVTAILQQLPLFVLYTVCK